MTFLQKNKIISNQGLKKNVHYKISLRNNMLKHLKSKSKKKSR
jgi:hypothetical protein